MTAKGGFLNERIVCEKFNNWQNDIEAKLWLEYMRFNINKIKSVKAIQIPTRIKKEDVIKYGYTIDEYGELVRFKKADLQIKVIIEIGDIIKVENISLKKANSNANYNQIDKRTIDVYKGLWGFDEEIAFWLKLFTGEYLPVKFLEKNKIDELKDKKKKRLFLNEMPENIQIKIKNFFEQNKVLIVSDILKGRYGFSVNWFLVTKFNKNENYTDWILRDINTTMNFFSYGATEISPKGSLKIGRITMQRKGGTPDPTKLQFKINPCDLFESVA